MNDFYIDVFDDIKTKMMSQQMELDEKLRTQQALKSELRKAKGALKEERDQKYDQALILNNVLTILQSKGFKVQIRLAKKRIRKHYQASPEIH